jgi:hypothetical protein
MKATIDIPDALYRRVKARSALEGRTIRDVTVELYSDWLEQADATLEPARRMSDEDVEEWIAGWRTLGEEIERHAVDPRSTLEILLADRR